MIETRMEIIELLSKSFIKREITDPQAILAEFDEILIRFENKVKNNIAKSNVISTSICDCEQFQACKKCAESQDVN